jgi:hypothetical protein
MRYRFGPSFSVLNPEQLRRERFVAAAAMDAKLST